MKFLLVGCWSQGGGQYGVLWGRDYCVIFNDNVVIVVMIEVFVGLVEVVVIVFVSGVDVVFVVSFDI